MTAEVKVIVSPAGIRVLLNLVVGRNSAHGLPGMAVMGGHKSTLMTLRRLTVAHLCSLGAWTRP